MKPLLELGNRIRPVERVAAPHVSRPEGISCFVCLSHPLVSVAAVSTGGIEVVEKDELAGEAMMIRCDILPEHHERGIPVSLWHIAENLIVGSVFLDDVHDVPDQRG